LSLFLFLFCLILSCCINTAVSRQTAITDYGAAFHVQFLMVISRDVTGINCGVGCYYDVYISMLVVYHWNVYLDIAHIKVVVYFCCCSTCGWHTVRLAV